MYDIYREVIYINVAYSLASIIIVGIHSFLNFQLCSHLSDKLRFHKFYIYLFCLINGVAAAFIMVAQHSDPALPYLACAAILLSELFILFKGGLTSILGVGIGSLLHLFVLRHIIVASVSIATGVSMHEVAFNPAYFPYVNISAFTAQIITLVLFIKLVPLDVLVKIMKDKSFYTGLLTLTLLLLVYMVYNSYIFLDDWYSVNLSVQEIVLSALVLVFFYTMMLLLIRIFNLYIYKKKTVDLEEKIVKDKILATAAFSYAEMIIEINCTKNAVTRVLIDSQERPTSQMPSFSEFLKFQSQQFTYPGDIEVVNNLNPDILIAQFNNGTTEVSFKYRSKRIVPLSTPTGVKSIGEEYLWYMMRVKISQNENTSDIIAVLTADNIEQEQQEELKLIKKAETDPLTGAYNKVAFADKVRAYLKNGGHGALFMFDLDNFKGVNDNMGHSVGDDVLRRSYSQLVTVFRSHDYIGRVGGDEFTVFMIDATGKEIIERKSVQICEKLHKTFTTEHGVPIEVTSSVGVAISPLHAQTFEALFDAADSAMYQAKNSGKNTYKIYDEQLVSSVQSSERHP